MNIDFEKIIKSFTKDKKAVSFAVLLVGLAITIFSIVYQNPKYADYGMALMLYSLASNFIRTLFHDLLGIKNEIFKGFLRPFWYVLYTLINLLLIVILTWFIINGFFYI